MVGDSTISVVGFRRNRLRFLLAALRSARRAHVLYLGHPRLAPLVLAVKRVSRDTRCVVATHGFDVWYPLPKLRRLGLAAGDVVTAPSSFTAQRLLQVQRLESHRVRILPWAVDPGLASSAAHPAGMERESKAKTLLSVARLVSGERKGVDEVIRAIPPVRAAVPEVRYEIVGSGSDQPRLERLAQKTGVADHISFAGSTSEERLAKHYAGCDVFVLPSLQEGFGVVYLEAMLFAKPVVAADHGGARDIVVHGETGFLVPPGDVSSLAQQILRLLQDPRLSGDMGQKGRTRVETLYSFEGFKEAFTRLLMGGV
jgi:phosphatidylinositol alpha-1,6-mannosyltransferase